MKIHHHFLISFLAGSSYLLMTGQSIDLINLMPWFTGGVLIDIDHLFTYTKNYRTFRLKKLLRVMLEDYEQNNQAVYIFHTIEFALFLGLVTIMTGLGWQYMAGYFLHLFCDGLRHKKMKKNYSWLKKWSLVYYWKRLKV